MTVFVDRNKITDAQLSQALILLHALSFWTGQPQVKALGLKVEGFDVTTDKEDVKTLEGDQAEALDLLVSLVAAGAYHPNNEVTAEEFKARTGKEFRNPEVSASEQA